MCRALFRPRFNLNEKAKNDRNKKHAIAKNTVRLKKNTRRKSVGIKSKIKHFDARARNCRRDFIPYHRLPCHFRSGFHL